MPAQKSPAPSARRQVEPKGQGGAPKRGAPRRPPCAPAGRPPTPHGVPLRARARHGGWRADGEDPRPSPEIQFLEEVVALVVDDDEGREILDFNAPDRLHP